MSIGCLTDDEIKNIIKSYTMTSVERQDQTLRSIEYIVKNNIEGDIIEIGVWKGGIIMLILLKLMSLGISNRIVHLYDTFEGMTEPTNEDVDNSNTLAKDIMHNPYVKALGTLQEVYTNVTRTGYPFENIKFHVGDIRNVKINEIPNKISLLRLDNDWYELYKFELPIFEPRVVKGGIVTIDDYGHWNGCKKAVDTYVQDKNYKIIPIDYTGVYYYKN